MKVFISQPMRDKTDEQIKEERAKAVNRIKETYNEDVEIDVGLRILVLKNTV